MGLHRDPSRRRGQRPGREHRARRTRPDRRVRRRHPARHDPRGWLHARHRVRRRVPQRAVRGRHLRRPDQLQRLLRRARSALRPHEPVLRHPHLHGHDRLHHHRHLPRRLRVLPPHRGLPQRRGRQRLHRPCRLVHGPAHPALPSAGSDVRWRGLDRRRRLDLLRPAVHRWDRGGAFSRVDCVTGEVATRATIRAASSQVDGFRLGCQVPELSFD